MILSFSGAISGYHYKKENFKKKLRFRIGEADRFFKENISPPKWREAPEAPQEDNDTQRKPLLNFLSGFTIPLYKLIIRIS